MQLAVKKKVIFCCCLRLTSHCCSAFSMEFSLHTSTKHCNMHLQFARVCVCVGSMRVCVSARVVCDMCALHYSCFGFPCALSLTHSLAHSYSPTKARERESVQTFERVHESVPMRVSVCVCVLCRLVS